MNCVTKMRIKPHGDINESAGKIEESLVSQNSMVNYLKAETYQMKRNKTTSIPNIATFVKCS